MVGRSDENYAQPVLRRQLGLRLTSRRLIISAGIALGAGGMTCLYLSDAVARSGSWWQGTLDAFGVGLVVAGIVDVAAILLLSQALTGGGGQRAKAANRAALSILGLTEIRDSAARPAESYEDRMAYIDLIDETVRDFGKSMDPFLLGRLSNLRYDLMMAEYEVTRLVRSEAEMLAQLDPVEFEARMKQRRDRIAKRLKESGAVTYPEREVAEAEAAAKIKKKRAELAKRYPNLRLPPE